MTSRRCTVGRLAHRVASAVAGLVWLVAVSGPTAGAAADASISISISSDVATAIGPPVTPEQALAHRHAPVLVVRTQRDPCGSGEAFLPMPVDPLFGRGGVVLRGPAGATISAPSMGDLAVADGTDWHLDLPGNALRPGCSYERLYDGMVAEGVAPPTVYARISTEDGRSDRLVLQYWMFYLYNDWNDRHEGDWEMVQLEFDVGDVESALTTSPERVAFAQHEGAQVSEWTDDEVQLDGETHPMVFVGEGSHASYFSAEQWFGKSAQSGFGCDNTRAPSTTVRPSVTMIDDGAAQTWLEFDGHWGERRPSFNNGPTGPASKSSWSTPVRWVDEEGRRGAVSIPAGGSTVTDFFCAAVAGGSSVMFRAVDQPIAMAGVVVLLVATLVLLVRRTVWRPVVIEPIAQRRRFGQVLLTSVRVVRRRPLWFASLGALLVAAGAVASLLQMFVLRTTEVGDLADVADRDSAFGAAVGLAVGLVVVVPVAGVITFAVSRAVLRFDDPEPPRRFELVRAAAQAPRAIAVQMLTSAVLLVGGLSVVLAPVSLWLVARWAVAMPAAADGRPPAMCSAELTRGHRVRALALFGWNVLLVSVVPASVGVLVLLIADASFGAVNLIATVVGLVTVPAAAVSTTLQYLDLRAAAAEAATVP